MTKSDRGGFAATVQLDAFERNLHMQPMTRYSGLRIISMFWLGTLIGVAPWQATSRVRGEDKVAPVFEEQTFVEPHATKSGDVARDWPGSPVRR